jgi:anti-sigma factor RsiW
MSWFRQRDETTEHSYFEERLSAYIDGELAPREQESVEQHLTMCPACRWSVSTLRQTVQWTAELPTVQVPRVFTIPASAEPARAARRRWSMLPVLQGATALVALLLVFAVAGDFMFTGFAPRSQSELPAVNMPAPVVETTVVEKQVAVTEVVQGEIQEQPPAEPEEAAPMMLQVAPSQAITVTEAASADAREMDETPMGGGVEGTDTASTGARAESPLPAGTPPPPGAEMLVAPTASPQPSLELPSTRAAVAPPTSEVLAYEAGEATEGETQVLEARGMRTPVINWLRIAEYTLGVALILLVGTTLAVMAWRRMMG